MDAHRLRSEPRRYTRPGPFVRDVAFIVRNARRLRAGSLSPALRERLILTVTAVNRCRYCAYGHRWAAVRAGIPLAEADALLLGKLRDAPAVEIPALVFARHWAETDGIPESTARRGLRDCYGADLANSIEVALHAIRVGNLTGNAVDHFLCRISRGRVGCRLDVVPSRQVTARGGQ